MDAIDVFWHGANLFAVSLLLGVVAAVGAKLLWRRALAAVSLPRLAGSISLAAALVTLGGLVAFGRDGRMATYGLMVLATAAVLGWYTRGRAAR